MEPQQVADQLDSQHYYGYCGDTKADIVLRGETLDPGMVLPPQVQIPCPLALCEQGAHVFTMVSEDELALLIHGEETDTGCHHKR